MPAVNSLKRAAKSLQYRKVQAIPHMKTTRRVVGVLELLYQLIDTGKSPYIEEITLGAG